MSTAVVYNASVNPSRRVKVTRMAERTILPRQTDASDKAENSTVHLAVAAPDTNLGRVVTAKRGRKPASNSSGLSRSAREAQRKLNHSIIEKARRTKINEALAELARLGATVDVLHTGGTLKDAEAKLDALEPKRSTPELVGEDDEDDADIDNDDDKDGDYGPPSSSRTRSGGMWTSRSPNSSKDHHSASKGKEKFKLDILIKTVENMQFLLERVRRLEAELKDVKSSSHSRPAGSKDFECLKCAERTLADLSPPSTFTTNKRKRHPSAEFYATNTENLEESLGDANDQMLLPEQRKRKVFHNSHGSEHNEHFTKRNLTLPSLPSISSWLLDDNPSASSVYSRDTFASLVARSSSSSPSLAGPASLPMLSPFDISHQRQRFPSNAPSPSSLAAYLPSPPSSTHFPASVLASSGGVPALELGPSSVSTASPTLSIRGRTGPTSISNNTSEASSVISDSASISTSRDVGTTSTSSSTSKTDTTYTIRSPEEESAASLLLHMKSSPPVFMTARSRKDSILERIDPLPSSMSSSVCPEISKPASNSVDAREALDSQSVMIAQTPSSILGLGATRLG